MYVETTKRVTRRGRFVIALSFVPVAILMMLGVSVEASMPGTTADKPGGRALASITTTVTATPAPPPGCELGWESVTYPTGDLLGVTALSPSQAWIGGTGRVLSWNGSQWAATPLPTQIPNVMLYRDSASSGNNIWGLSNTGAVRWDGANWNLIPYPTPPPPPFPVGYSVYNFASIGAWSPYDVWLTGGYDDGQDGPHPSVIFHWNGVRWNLIASAEGSKGNAISPEGGYACLSSVGSVAIAGRDTMWGTGRNRCSYMKAEYSFIVNVSPAGIQSFSPGSDPSYLTYYDSIAVAGPNDVWVFGRDSGGSIIFHWNGVAFTEVAHPNVAGFSSSEAIAPDNIWAATTSGSFLHWDGNTWHIEPGPAGNAWQLAGSGPYDLWAVNMAAQGTQGIMHYPDLPAFTDVPPDNTFYANIRCLACRGIISGYADGTFKPNNLVTRGQLAKIVSSAAGYPESPDPQIFEDVPPSNTFYQWINRLARRGHMSGYVCGGVGEPCITGMPYFRPFANATRGQTSKIVSNAAGYTEIPTDQTFEDVPPTHTFYNEIQRLASRNIMQGYTCGGVGEPCVSGRPYFRPQNNVTRGQSAKIVANTFYPGCDTPSER